jgi:hypothetical protein
MKLLNNLETLKLELHFEKSEYLEMSEGDKSKLKSSFLWSNYGKCWVSRTKYPNNWRAEQTAKALGAGEPEKVGERLTMAERIEVASEKAEARAERYEGYSDNAEKRAVNLQATFNECRKDWSWLTQPIIAGHSGSRAFANHRNKVMARYERGFEEYKKSAYYQDRAATARATAVNVKLEDKVYLTNKIKECNKSLKLYQEHIVQYENALYKIQQGELLKNRSGEILTEELIEKRIAERLERYEFEQDKLDFFEDCLNALGGVKFGKDNIKVGMIVNLKHWDKCEIVGTGPLNVTYKILEGGAKGLGGKMPYAGIIEILSA